MSEEIGAAYRRWRREMPPRSIDEGHRASTMLELFFDLCFVVAVAQVAASFHHAASADHFGDALIGYPLVFFSIWWAWMNFTWFASAYDNDDSIYRLAVMFIMAGALVLAAGVPRAFEQDDWRVMTLGFAIMRVPLAGLWLRAAYHQPGSGSTQKRYALGILLCMAGWGVLAFLPKSVLLPGFILMATAELAVPVLSERVQTTPWHAGHIVERYGLFTIIVLGESILAATLAVQAALDAPGYTREVIVIAAGGLLIVFSMWWLYFAQDAAHFVIHVRERFAVTRSGFAWAYGHLLVFGSIAAVGAGLAVAVDSATQHTAITQAQTGLMLTVPVAVYLLSLWLLVAPVVRRMVLPNLSLPIAAVGVLATTPLELAPLLTGVILALTVAIHVFRVPQANSHLHPG